MKQKLLPEIHFFDILIFTPIAIVFLTQVLPSNAILGLLSMFLICIFPGYALLDRFKLHSSSRFQDLFFSVLLSLLLLGSVYAAYSVFCYGLGFEHSLTRKQVFLIAIIIMIFSTFYLRNTKKTSLNIQLTSNTFMNLKSKKLLLYIIPLALPLMSLIAVVRLNTRNDSISTAVLLYFCIGILLLLCSKIVLIKSAGLHYLFFYCTLLTLLLGSTFRGDGGFWGVDINWEFTVAKRVLLQQHWIPLSESPYNSMLSITVLPVVLSFLTKFSLSIIFKLFYVLIGALIPLASYCLLKSYVRHSIAMGVVIMETVASISYISQMTALARQFVGIAFFIGILLVMFDPKWSRKKKARVILLFACGLSFSHYSSAYLCSIIFILAGIASFFICRIGYFRSAGFKIVNTISLGLGILCITLLWNGVLNNSAKDLNSVATNFTTNGSQLLPNKTGKFIDRWLSGVTVSPEVEPADFKAVVLKSNSYKYPNFQTAPVSLTYDVVKAEYQMRKPLFGKSTATLFYWLYVLVNTVLQGLIVLQVLLGTVSIFGHLSKRRKIPINGLKSQIPTALFELIPLASVSFLCALFLRISGTGSSFYNPERAAFQLALIFSLSIALLLEFFIRRNKRFHRAFGTVLLISSFVFLQQATGLIGYIYGSPSSRISSTISIDSSFIISKNEQSAAEWINKNTPKNSYLQSDDTAALVTSQMNIFDTKPAIAQIAPFALFNGSYVYLSKANLETGITHQSVGGLRFKVPLDYLDQNLSVAYSSGGARVYR